MCSTLPLLFTCVLTCDTFGALRAHARDRISSAISRELTSHSLRAFVAAHRVAFRTRALGSLVSLGLAFVTLCPCGRAPLPPPYSTPHQRCDMWGRTRLRSSRRMERGRGKPTPRHYYAMGRRDDTELRSTCVVRPRMGWPTLLSSLFLRLLRLLSLCSSNSYIPLRYR